LFIAPNDSTKYSKVNVSVLAVFDTGVKNAIWTSFANIVCSVS